jgi:hypothetical protein
MANRDTAARALQPGQLIDTWSRFTRSTSTNYRLVSDAPPEKVARLIEERSIGFAQLTAKYGR